MSQQLEVNLVKAPSEETLTRTILGLTGALTVFWCPKPEEGKPYNGHAHLDYPAGVINPIKTQLTDTDFTNTISS